MEDFSKLLLEERTHSEQFKTNFLKLKNEFDKMVAENHRLNDEICKFKEYKPEEPNEALKRKLKNAEKELQGKDLLIASLQEKFQTMNESLKKKLRHDKNYVSRLTSTENMLEQTKILLSNLQLETSVLVKNIECSRKADEQDRQQDLTTLANRCAKSDHERKIIARQVIKATTKAKKTTEMLKHENGLLSFAITKLKESIDKVCLEKSELSSVLETLKVQYGQNHGEMLMQIRNLECENTKLGAKCDSLERNIQEALREKVKAVLAFQAAENNEAKLRSNLCSIEIQFENASVQYKRDLEHKDNITNLEVQELKKNIHMLKVELDQERFKIQHQSENLRIHEKELALAKEALRIREFEISSQVQDVKISTENKYRALLEEKFQIEMEISRKCAEIESQLILERNLKTSLELEIRKLASDNQILNERIRSLDEFPINKKLLQNTVDMVEKEKNKLSDELDSCKQSSIERYEIMVKERELIRSQQVLAEEKMVKTVNELQEHVRQLQSQLTASEQNAESQMQRLESALKANQQKSQQYAKLIWKLRQRLVLNTQQPLSTVAPSSLAIIPNNVNVR